MQQPPRKATAGWTRFSGVRGGGWALAKVGVGKLIEVGLNEVTRWAYVCDHAQVLHGDCSGEQRSEQRIVRAALMVPADLDQPPLAVEVGLLARVGRPGRGLRLRFGSELRELWLAFS
jgi:hypothetical protein